MSLGARLQVIILNYNSHQDTLALYQELGELKLPYLRICVVDNCSTSEDYHALKAGLPKGILHRNSKNEGYAKGNEIGIQQAIEQNIPYVLLLNPDIRLAKDCIPKLLSTIAAHEKLAVVGPRICFRNDPEKIYSDGAIVYPYQAYKCSHLHGNERIQDYGDEGVLSDIDYVNGSVFLARTKVFEEIGFMDHRFFLYYEESEWCLRAKKAGYKLAVNTSGLAYHTSSSKNELYHYYMTRNRLLIAKKLGKAYRETKSQLYHSLKNEFMKSLRKKRIPNAIWRSKLKGYVAGIIGY